MNKLRMHLSAYTENRRAYEGVNYFKFLKRVYKDAVAEGVFNFTLLQRLLNFNYPTIMDLEFIKVYVSMLSPDNLAMIGMFENYWESDNSSKLAENISGVYALELDNTAVFAALVANNDIVKVLNMLILVSDRINSISNNRDEDEFCSRCLSDYDTQEFKDAVAGLQFFGFGNKEKPNTKKAKSEAYTNLEIDYLHDKNNGFYKDITRLHNEIKVSLKKNKKLISDKDINNAISYAITFEDGTKLDYSKITREDLNDKYSGGTAGVVLVSWDISESGFEFVENFKPDDTYKEVWELQLDSNTEIHNSIIDVVNEENLKTSFDESMSTSSFIVDIEDLFNNNDKYKKLLEKANI